jgi:citrate lyase subunit beta / citryl-CoA lyase
MPASNGSAIEKARTLPCDVVILDLEDAVAPEIKATARIQAVEAVSQGGFGHREVVIRINPLDSEWGTKDLAAVASAGADAVLLPKVSSPETLFRARGALGNGNVALWSMIETCRAIVRLDPIVSAASDAGLTCLVVGTNDLAKEMRCRPSSGRSPLLPILTQIVLAGRMAGLAVLDGVSNVIDDEGFVEAECVQALDWGFDGKTLIHPSQIAPANRVFTPTADEVAWAEAIDAAFKDPQNAGKGAIRIDGKMVELLHLEDARRTLALAAHCAKSSIAA